jgi:hypothetical protein
VRKEKKSEPFSGGSRAIHPVSDRKDTQKPPSCKPRVGLQAQFVGAYPPTDDPPRGSAPGQRKHHKDR